MKGLAFIKTFLETPKNSRCWSLELKLLFELNLRRNNNQDDHRQGRVSDSFGLLTRTDEDDFGALLIGLDNDLSLR